MAALQLCAKRVPEQSIEAPAGSPRDFSRDHVLSPVAGAPKGWRRKISSPLDAARESKQISQDEFDAGAKLAVWLALEERTGRDSSAMEGRVDGGHDYLMWPELMTDARRGLTDVRRAMNAMADGPRFWMVCRRFCAGYSAREACKEAMIDRKRTWEFIRLALSKLELAMCRSSQGRRY